MKHLITSLFLLLTLTSFSQSIPKTDIVGTWIVKTFQAPGMGSEENQAILQTLEEALLSSKFEFNSDGTCKFIFENGVPAMLRELEIKDNAFWKYDEVKGVIRMGTEADNFTLMGLEVSTQNGQTIFTIEESPFSLEVVKR